MNTAEFSPSGKAASCLPTALPPYTKVNDVTSSGEAKLVHRGKREVFQDLFRQYEDKIYGYELSLVGDVEEAHDLTQKTFMRAWEKLPTLRDESRLIPWLYRIARHLAFDYWRSKKKALLCSWENLTEQQGMMSVPGPEESVAGAELVRVALAALPSKFRDCLLYRAVYGLSQQEIAELVGISKESVNTYLYYARRQFRQVYLRLKRE